MSLYQRPTQRGLIRSVATSSGFPGVRWISCIQVFHRQILAVMDRDATVAVNKRERSTCTACSVSPGSENPVDSLRVYHRRQGWERVRRLRCDGPHRSDDSHTDLLIRSDLVFHNNSSTPWAKPISIFTRIIKTSFCFTQFGRRRWLDRVMPREPPAPLIPGRPPQVRRQTVHRSCHWSVGVSVEIPYTRRPRCQKGNYIASGFSMNRIFSYSPKDRR